MTDLLIAATDGSYKDAIGGYEWCIYEPEDSDSHPLHTFSARATGHPMTLFRAEAAALFSLVRYLHSTFDNPPVDTGYGRTPI